MTEQTPDPNRRAFDGVAIIGAYAMVFLVITIIAKIAFTDVSSSSDTLDSTLVQMVQWTITTVLTLGAALIGLNWYQNQHRYERDKADLDSRNELTGRAVKDLDNRTQSSLDKFEEHFRSLEIRLMDVRTEQQSQDRRFKTVLRSELRRRILGENDRYSEFMQFRFYVDKLDSSKYTTEEKEIILGEIESLLMFGSDDFKLWLGDSVDGENELKQLDGALFVWRGEDQSYFQFLVSRLRNDVEKLKSHRANTASSSPKDTEDDLSPSSSDT